MAFDYKKEYREFYLPKKRPELITVPPMNFAAVRGKGDPNEEDGAYKQAVGLLYGAAYTIKMSKHLEHRIEGYFDFVVPPLEGLWWQRGVRGVDYSHKGEAAAKKKADFSGVEFFTYEEGLCVQCMHVGPYDDEPATVGAMDAFAGEQGYVADMSDMGGLNGSRFHHEIYLSDVRKCRPENLKTVIRHPVRRA